MCSNSSLTTLDLTFKGSSISLHVVCEMGKLMPTGVIGLIDLSVPPEVYLVYIKYFPCFRSPPQHKDVCVCVCVCVCVHADIHTHASSQEKKMNEALGMI